ncbi:MAG: UDP-N-acetylglucosamine 2-epimerase (non-hydrolyzing) [Verrucomicrobia bacterium]|nr:UDP-N-acetylglucosamine 2-epimerase (non-hydrolyzing) [Verrucomicrobiota bacterium]MBU1909485.1 UDP-N-acetylglucosamine 2-epimerase (non-hydrolyzing) [Verrucomicrobiota bacterium]
MKIVSVIGARPQFIKAAAVSRVLRERHTEILVHTGQHYDDNMSAVFFEELAIPEPDVNLGIGSGPQGTQTGAMLQAVEGILLREKPDWTLVYGDTNSTLAGALAAAKLNIPVAHVEAGLRSFNRKMPEEINRVLTDRLSSLLLCPSRTAVDNLAREGIRAGVLEVGDVMADALAFAVEQATGRSSVLERMNLKPGGYLLATIHRAGNTDDLARLTRLLSALDTLAEGEPVIFPVHPRTRRAMAALPPPRSAALRCIEPVGYLDMVMLEKSARLILTDSGGVQKEAYWLGVPCLTLREETEWVETVAADWNRVVGTSPETIVSEARSFTPPAERPALYGEGRAAGHCVRALETYEAGGGGGHAG